MMLRRRKRRWTDRRRRKGEGVRFSPSISGHLSVSLYFSPPRLSLARLGSCLAVAYLSLNLSNLAPPYDLVSWVLFQCFLFLRFFFFVFFFILRFVCRLRKRKKNKKTSHPWYSPRLPGSGFQSFIYLFITWSFYFFQFPSVVTDYILFSP